MVKVCDAIMGAGKSSAAITYMNEHPEYKFIYITPYLDEAKRIAKSCPILHFYEPQKTSRHSGSKTMHTIELVEAGKNIATTHQAFRSYPQELLSQIHEKGYIMIIDENVDILETYDINDTDLQIVLNAGYIKETERGTYAIGEDTYNGNMFRDLLRIFKTRELSKVFTDNSKFYYYWQLPPELITAAKDVYILTYLFKGQELHHFLELHHIPYEFVGVRKEDYGLYRFCDQPGIMPEYVKDLKNKIHILQDEKINAIGKKRTALSHAWFDRGGDNVVQLKNNIYNYFRNIAKAKSDECLWSTFKSAKRKLSGKGYTKGFLPFNKRAVNGYRDRTALVYALNVYMDVGKKLFYKNQGLNIDEDIYALSVMVQWIWRSAIRDGKEINLYIPSSRMRNLLIDWIDKSSKGETIN